MQEAVQSEDLKTDLDDVKHMSHSAINASDTQIKFWLSCADGAVSVFEVRKKITLHIFLTDVRKFIHLMGPSLNSSSMMTLLTKRFLQMIKNRSEQAIALLPQMSLQR